VGSFRHAILHRVFEVEVYKQILSASQLERRSRSRVGPEVERRIFDPSELEGIGRSGLLTKALRLI
jgi:hypothetical protein